MSIYWAPRAAPSLHNLVNSFCTALPHHIPESRSAMLFGGITLGAFSPPWSDVDLIVWVNMDEVTPNLEERAVSLWKYLAEKPLGHLIYLYVAPKTVVGGPMNVAGGGLPGQPNSLRVYRHKSRWMQGYPLSLPDTVSLLRYGAVLSGRDIRDDLPSVTANWPTIYLDTRLDQLIRAVSSQIGPYGSDAVTAAQSWGADGIMSEPLWCARQLYSQITGEMLAKEHAAQWYLGRCSNGALAEALRLILGWRGRGEAPDSEVVRVAQLIRPAMHEFLHQVAEWLMMPVEGLPSELPSVLEWVKQRLHS